MEPDGPGLGMVNVYRTPPRELAPGRSCSEPTARGGQRNREQNINTKSRAPSLAQGNLPVGTGFWGPHCLPIRKEAEPSAKKTETERGGEDAGDRDVLLAPPGQGWGRGALPLPRGKLQRKPPWAEPRPKNRERKRRAGKGVSH